MAPSMEVTETNQEAGSLAQAVKECGMQKLRDNDFRNSEAKNGQLSNRPLSFWSNSTALACAFRFSRRLEMFFPRHCPRIHRRRCRLKICWLQLYPASVHHKRPN